MNKRSFAFRIELALEPLQPIVCLPRIRHRKHLQWQVRVAAARAVHRVRDPADLVAEDEAPEQRQEELVRTVYSAVPLPHSLDIISTA